MNQYNQVNLSPRIQGRRRAAWIICTMVLAGCGGGGGGAAPPTPPPMAATTDTLLRSVIAAEGLSGDPTAGRTLPSINNPLAQLGKKLFFSKSLSGDFDTACASCHHPALGGGDGLSLPVGTGAVNPDVVGLSRTRSDGKPNVGRHSQTVFNIGLYDAGLFWDSRVESISKVEGTNGAGSGIRTPDSQFNAADPNAGETLPAAQARFPVTIEAEMLGTFMPGASGDAIRTRLAERIGNYGAGTGELTNNNWLAEFQSAFVSSEPAHQLVTFDNIALAIAEYQRSMVFVDTPWKAYVAGDNAAISESAKQGALVFFGDPANQGENGLGCSQCHSGDFFTDEQHHTVAFPQIGPGKGDDIDGDNDFGREQQSSLASERFRFRTPSLLNLEATAPYSHSGVYDNLLDATGHYVVPDIVFDDFETRGGICSLPQFAQHADCATLYPRIRPYFAQALNKVRQDRISDPEFTFSDTTNHPLSNAPLLLEFLSALTDPCVLDRACLAPWIPSVNEAPDDHQLNAIDANGDLL